MRVDYLNRYGVESIAQAFYWLGKYESVLVPSNNVELIQDIKIHLETFDMKYEVSKFNEFNVGINLL